jgi:hypothetical protein
MKPNTPNIKALYALLGTFCTAFFLLFSAPLSAQPRDTANSRNYAPINENKLADTRWRYAYTTNSGSRTPIHAADENFSHYLWLKFDYTYEQVLNGKRSYGMWAVNDKKNKLYYKFKNSKWWDIVEFKDDKLILEFADKESSLQFVFQRIPNDVAPFAKDKDQLPEVYVYDGAPSKKGKRIEKAKSTGFFAWFSNIFRAPEVGKAAKDSTIAKIAYNPNEKAAPVEIDIALVGGGYYGGIDPVLKNYIQIKTTGRVIKEQETEFKGAIKSKKDLSRQELENLARFILDKKFFDFANEYDCDSPECRNRKNQKPKPIPLRLTVQYGDQRKTVSIPIWGPDSGGRRRYIDYPPALDLIIENIMLASMTTNIGSK